MVCEVISGQKITCILGLLMLLFLITGALVTPYFSSWNLYEEKSGFYTIILYGHYLLGALFVGILVAWPLWVYKSVTSGVLTSLIISQILLVIVNLFSAN